MKRSRSYRLWAGIRNQVTGRFSDGEARLLCYLLGPVSAALMIHFNRYGAIWSIRFHAFHSMLMTALWAAAWGTLRLAEGISPWLLGTFARELRFAANVVFLFIWLGLLLTAYEGSRWAIVPPLHRLAVRLARRYEKRFRKAPLGVAG